ncbi:MAG: DUF559 domain-containing protein [Alphaproteobacteria bacterium]|nr:DUF559 domain-containing protein [Alphaproteobacteria bacterium]
MAFPTARNLRSNLTDTERRLWYRLRRRQCAGFRFRRQVPIGAFVVDFACLSEMLVVEVDGGQHADEVERDAVRTAWLEKEGYRVIRFWNNEVLQNTDGVVEAIERALRSAPPP